ncbi:hypothetical protein EVB41_040 [Rhizobium phage RHph_TM3_14A]|nr:hypothetical protein EVB29_040 [Rhizobium phage RHph_TM27A]QIG66960.1 hypothetical protein EVB30_040 [Rhizobium phage RHph_TM27B]QIG67049.1 hypothetical protein EVB31_039 [Rhizobium phage RHph_TM29]QIG67505.1 hypothetical protein EVB41_040 [Rhizobium phage RHph_TM3_14A]
MAYVARFYSLETWEVEESGVYPTIAAVKDAAQGRVYTLEVTHIERVPGWCRALMEFAALAVFMSAVAAWAVGLG